jgi:hypothetical protein
LKIINEQKRFVVDLRMKGWISVILNECSVTRKQTSGIVDLLNKIFVFAKESGVSTDQLMKLFS